MLEEVKLTVCNFNISQLKQHKSVGNVGPGELLSSLLGELLSSLLNNQGNVLEFYSHYVWSRSPTSSLTLCLSPGSYSNSDQMKPTVTLSKFKSWY